MRRTFDLSDGHVEDVSAWAHGTLQILGDSPLGELQGVLVDDPGASTPLESEWTTLSFVDEKGFRKLYFLPTLVRWVGAVGSDAKVRLEVFDGDSVLYLPGDPTGQTRPADFAYVTTVDGEHTKDTGYLGPFSLVLLNGIYQIPDIDWTRSGSLITYLKGGVPASDILTGSTFAVWFGGKK